MHKPFLMDEGLLSIILAICGQLVKMLITLTPNDIFESNFAHIYSNIVQQLVCKMVTSLAVNHFGQSMPFSEIAHNY